MTTRNRTFDWATISAAGIDTDRVEPWCDRYEPDQEQYAVTSGDGNLVLRFGEYGDTPEDGFCAEEYETWTDTDGTVREDPPATVYYFETATECLAYVKQWCAAN